MHTTPATTPHGGATCAEPERAEAARTEVPAEAAEAEARRRWLATAAWPEVVFATA